jgi:hypothetical protein
VCSYHGLLPYAAAALLLLQLPSVAVAVPLSGLHVTAASRLLAGRVSPQ